MEANIELELRRRGVASAGELAAALKVSQPTVSRHLAQLGERVVRLGRGRATLYAMAREINPVGSTWPLYAIDEEGLPRLTGMLRALQGKSWVLEQAVPWETLRGGEYPHGLFPDFPWFLDDLRPQGFLGRAFARTYGRTLGLPPDPTRWDADAVLRALVQQGSDLSGNWVLGEEMLAEAQRQRMTPQSFVAEEERSESYPALADSTLAGELPGSSAGGEQPKFTARVGQSEEDVRHVIVKFSGGSGRPEDQRWADLLISEHVAATILSVHGIPASKTELIMGAGRVFLESTRFDRVGAHGRKGLSSLWALDGAFFGKPYTNWTSAATRLMESGWFCEEDAERLCVLWWFGNLIGNTDMHYGNVSLFLEANRPLALAPSYDMLPMLYRPDAEGRLPDRIFSPLPPPPEAMRYWHKAVDMALQFWKDVARTPEVSSTFQAIAKQNGKIVLEYQRKFSLSLRR
jgi:DNA-binding transcriptional ArsR family regulator